MNTVIGSDPSSLVQTRKAHAHQEFGCHWMEALGCPVDQEDVALIKVPLGHVEDHPPGWTSDAGGPGWPRSAEPAPNAWRCWTTP